MIIKILMKNFNTIPQKISIKLKAIPPIAIEILSSIVAKIKPLNQLVYSSSSSSSSTSSSNKISFNKNFKISMTNLIH